MSVIVSLLWMCVSVFENKYKIERRDWLVTVIGSVWLEIVWLSLPSSLVTEQVKLAVWTERLSFTGLSMNCSSCTDVSLANTTPSLDTHCMWSATPESHEHVSTAFWPALKGKWSLVMVAPAWRYTLIHTHIYFTVLVKLACKVVQF